MMNIKEIKRIVEVRKAFMEVADSFNIDLEEEIKVGASLSNAKYIEAYVNNETSELNRRISSLENLLELMGDKYISGIDATPVLIAEAILNKYDIVKIELMKMV